MRPQPDLPAMIAAALIAAFLIGTITLALNIKTCGFDRVTPSIITK